MLSPLLSPSALPLAEVGFVFAQSNAAGKIIVLILLLGSVFAWSVMLTKLRELRSALQGAERFLITYRSASHPISVFRDEDHKGMGPLGTVYEKACVALGAAIESGDSEAGDLFQAGSSRMRLTDRHVSSVRNAAERTVADQALLLETHMGLLATAATTAPFLGLLGTVWGVMESFGSMSSSGSALLSEVAPGISGALLTTVVGLLVALPSSIGYNMLGDQIRKLSVMMDNFAQELVADLERIHLM